MKPGTIAIVLLGSAGLTFGQVTPLSKSGISGTGHDIGGNGCSSCHAPHNGSIFTGGTDGSTGQILLWSRKFSTVTFGVYSSPSMKIAASEIGGASALAATEPRMYSLLCMSCHDGVTSASSVTVIARHKIGDATSSFGLTNDHPINMSHNPSVQTTLQPVATVTGAGLPLYGTSNSVQCSTCHEPHNDTNTSFLRLPNTGSALCLNCHI